MKWFWKNKFHFLIWAVMLAYLLSASQINAAFFLKNGKPMNTPAKMPAESGHVISFISELSTASFEGEEVYLFYGWVFDPDIPESGDFVKKLVLHSPNGDLVFPANNVKNNGIAATLEKYHMNLENAAFRVELAKDAIKPGNYRIGFILEDQQGNVRGYKLFDKYIEREPNSLRYIGGQ